MDPLAGRRFLMRPDPPGPVRIAIVRAIDRIIEADESILQKFPSDPLGVVGTVEYAYNRAEDRRGYSSPLFRSYFVESIAALAITRDAFDQGVLGDTEVNDLLGGALHLLDPLCAPA